MATEEVRDAYGSRAETLADMLGTTVSAEDPDRAVIELWADTVSGRILDVGSGTGRWAGHLAGLGHDIEGLEPVEEFLEIARQAHPRVPFRLASIADLACTDQQWSAILAWYSLIHLGPEQMPETLATLRRALNDEGVLLVSFFTGPRLEAFDHPVTTAYRWPVQAMTSALDRAGFAVTGHHTHPQGLHASVTAQARRKPDGH